jgi:hypothetical protein
MGQATKYQIHPDLRTFVHEIVHDGISWLLKCGADGLKSRRESPMVTKKTMEISFLKSCCWQYAYKKEVNF